MFLSTTRLFAGVFEESVCDVINASIASQWCAVEPIRSESSNLQKRSREEFTAWPEPIFIEQSPQKKVKGQNSELEEHLRTVVLGRNKLTSVPITIDTEKYYEFSHRFPFALTPCQEGAIHEIAQEFQGMKPMSRVLIGSLGFGKTEVALRKAFMIAAQGKQVVLVAPSKALAQQHFELFDTRFWLTNIEVVLVPSGRKPKALSESIERGFAKIIIGTSAVLSQNIIYKG